ncbi:hypothetical protein BKA70DRAFT_1516965 [Coprinopsis sp. MPI-PUGE-AT-0042]|nr:hypothetical protein BKA70DRAFT_1516965 [Coprinopsis sp. MPI-PUGE-AT-0042]
MHMDRQNHQDRRFVHLNDTGSSENVTRESLPWFSFVHANPAGQPPITASLESTSQQRDDETADQGPTIVKKVINSWFSSGFNNADINEQCFAIYKGQSEPTSLTARKAHCKQEFILAARSSSKYLKKSGSPEEPRAAREAVRRIHQGSWVGYARETRQRRRDADSVAPKAYVDDVLETHRRNSDKQSLEASRPTLGSLPVLTRLCRNFKAVMLLCKDNKVTEEISKVVAGPLAPFEPPDNSLTAASAHGEAEASTVFKHNEPDGFEYANKLQRIFTDMALSKDPTTVQTPPAAVARRQATTSPSPAIRILGTNFWLLNPPTYEYTIPPELTQTYQRF